MKFLITGGCGFLGTNLSAALIERGDDVVVIDNFFRQGSRQNLAWLRGLGPFTFHEADTRDAAAMEALIAAHRPDCLFHLAGQVAMSTSLSDPRLDFEINVVGGVNVLEAVRRRSPETVVFYSSTNKVYGDLLGVRIEERERRYVAPDHPDGFDERLPLDFQSPYGCSKGAVDQYMRDYDRVFGVRTVVFRHSSIFGQRQFPTYDQGWVGWFVGQALQQRERPDAPPFTISGDGKQVRDVLFAGDIVRCYLSALQAIDRCHGQAFNIGGGMRNSLSLLELFDLLERELDVRLRYTPIAWRQSDQRIFVADIARATAAFGWAPGTSAVEGVRGMIEWMRHAG
jgi:CDP-paratose 2-epimerase